MSWFAAVVVFGGSKGLDSSDLRTMNGTSAGDSIQFGGWKHVKKIWFPIDVSSNKPIDELNTLLFILMIFTTVPGTFAHFACPSQSVPEQINTVTMHEVTNYLHFQVAKKGIVPQLIEPKQRFLIENVSHHISNRELWESSLVIKHSNGKSGVYIWWVVWLPWILLSHILGCDYHPKWLYNIFQRGGPTTKQI